MRKLIGLLLFGAAVLSASGSAFALAPASTGADRVCQAQAGRVLAETADVRVLSQPASGGARRIVACVHGGRGLVRLGESHDDLGSTWEVNHVSVAGRYVAFERFLFNNTFIGETVAVYDVRRRVRVSEDPSGVQTDDRHLSDTGLGPVTDIVLRPDGHVAWMARSFGDSLMQTRQVWKRDQTGLTAVAEGPGLVPGSLAAATSTLYWLDGDAPVSDPFS